VSASKDFSRLAAAQSTTRGLNPGLIKISLNSGLTWKTLEDAGHGFWRGLAISGDGSTLSALRGTDATALGSIYATKLKDDSGHGSGSGGGGNSGSSGSGGGSGIGSGTGGDGGNSTVFRFDPGSVMVNDWGAIVSAYYQGYIVIAQRRGAIFNSIDGGLSWERRDSAGIGNWTAVTSSSVRVRVSTDGRYDIFRDGGSQFVAVQSSNSSGHPGSIYKYVVPLETSLCS